MRIPVESMPANKTLQAEEFLKARNEAYNPKEYSSYGTDVKNYLKDKYRSKGSSIVMVSHRTKDIDPLDYTNRSHVEDILMHKDDFVGTKRIFARVLELFNESLPLDRIDDVNGDPMFFNLERYLSEENVLLYQIVSVGFILLPGNRFLFLRNNEKHSRLPNLTTMVQGHVETSYFVSSMSAKQYMEYELCREVVEEVDITCRGNSLSVVELAKNTEMKKIIYSTINEVAREHVGALSIVDLRHYDDIKVTSKEETHDVLIGSIEDIILAGDLDVWSRIVIDAIIDGELTFKNNLK